MAIIANELPGPPMPEEWGIFCRHNVKIVEADPCRQDQDGYPIGRIVEPWPCARGCTREEFEADLEAEEAAYWESRQADLYR